MTAHHSSLSVNTDSITLFDIKSDILSIHAVQISWFLFNNSVNMVNLCLISLQTYSIRVC